MNRFLFEMTGITEEEMNTFFKKHHLNKKKRENISKFFQDVKEGLIIKNSQGELIYKKDNI